MATLNCKNCGYAFDGNFCSQCGQKAKTERLNWHYLRDELKYTFLHINGGLLYTAKQLFVRPGHMIREFIEGKRVKHYKPILFVVVVAGVYGLLMHYMDMTVFFKNMPDNSNAESRKKASEFMEFFVGHYSMFEILLIPFVSLCSWLAFRSWGYNYIEHIILNTFNSGQRIVYSIAIFPILYFTDHTSQALLIRSLLGLPTYALTIWTFIQFFKGRDLGMLILRILLMFALIVGMGILLLIAGVTGYLVLFRH